MAQLNSSIGNVTANTGLVEMAMAYSRSRVICAAARLGVADALGDDVRSVGFLAEKCQADANALYRLLRALASMGVTEETAPEHFRLTAFGKPLRRDVPQSAWPAVVFWADLLADSWTLLTDCVRTGKSASQVRDPKISSRWEQDPESGSIFRAVMGTAPAENYAPIAAPGAPSTRTRIFERSEATPWKSWTQWEPGMLSPRACCTGLISAGHRNALRFSQMLWEQ
jgi:Dimerisation domain